MSHTFFHCKTKAHLLVPVFAGVVAADVEAAASSAATSKRVRGEKAFRVKVPK